jgi:DNA-binding NarL/FixJ family response regulator
MGQNTPTRNARFAELDSMIAGGTRAARPRVAKPHVVLPYLPQVRSYSAVKLLPYEDKVLRELIDGGKSNAAIAAALGLTPFTVKEYMFRIMRKTGASNRVDLALWAYKRSLTPPEQHE